MGGTERGIQTPEITCSPCFGGAFLTLRPSIYGNLLLEKIKQHGCKVFLVNTGFKWKRGTILNLRRQELIHKIMDGSIISSYGKR